MRDASSRSRTRAISSPDMSPCGSRTITAVPDEPATIGLEEMTPANIITVDLDGQGVGGTCPVTTRYIIHSEVLRARPDIQAVIHTHAPHAVAFSSLGKELVPVNNEAGYFHKRLPVFAETSDLIVTPENGKAVARCLAQDNAVLLRNHGIVAAGRSSRRRVGRLESSAPAACSSWRSGPVGRSTSPKARISRRRTARQPAGPLHQRVQLPRALMVPRARQARQPLLRRPLQDGLERL